MIDFIKIKITDEALIKFGIMKFLYTKVNQKSDLTMKSKNCLGRVTKTYILLNFKTDLR